MLAPVLGVAFVVASGAAGQVQPINVPGADHVHEEVAAPKSLSDGVLRILDLASTLEAAVEAGDLSSASIDAASINEIAIKLVAVARADASVKADPDEVNRRIHAVGAAALSLHLAADAGNVARSRGGVRRLAPAVKALEELTPAMFICPMLCEGAKSYGAPGECPVCAMDLKKVTTAKYTVEVRPVGGVVRAGVATNLVFEIKDPSGVTVRDLSVVHEKVLHLLMVSADLSWYAHEHPELRPDGTLELVFTFPAPGEYTLFNDFTPASVGMQVVPVKVGVIGGPAERAVPPVVEMGADASTPKTIDGFTVGVDTGGELVAGASAKLTFHVSRGGVPVTDLRPFLGAMGHLVIISKDLRTFVHSHPHEPAGAPPERLGGPAVEFEARFPRPGLYRGWGQFQHGQTVITAPFTFDVRPRPASR